jgi:hypothetical protein
MCIIERHHFLSFLIVSWSMLHTRNPPRQTTMVQSVEEWFNTMPPFTKAYFLAALGTTIAVQTNLVSPYSLYLDFDLVISKLEVLWRDESSRLVCI